MSTNHSFVTYYVTVMVNDLVQSSYDFLKRGNEFFLDAIRIYDPIDVTPGNKATAGSDSAVAYAAYLADVEAHPIVQEIRQILLSAEDFNSNGKIQDGAVFVDYATIPAVNGPVTGEDVSDPALDHEMGKEDNPAHVTSDILTYNKIGPNNETYLGPQQLVAFQILVYSNRVPYRLDIGAKSIVGDTTKLLVKTWDTSSKLERSYRTTIQGPSHQYYSLYLANDVFKSTRDENGVSCYMTTVLITNPTAKSSTAAANILSITDVKAAFRDPVTYTKPTGKKAATMDSEAALSDEETLSIRFVVPGDLMEQLTPVLEELNGICREHVPGDWEPHLQPGVGVEGSSVIRCTLCGLILESKAVAPVSDLAFKGASVSLHSDLSIHYKVSESYFTESGYTDPYVLIEVGDQEIRLEDYEIEKGLYVFTHANIAPHEMGDTVRATLYAWHTGELYSSPVKEYSVATYCYNMLEKATGNSYATLRTLLVDILHYGAKTQEYMGYRLDSLCNASLTEEQLACGTTGSRKFSTLQDREYVKVAEPSVLWLGVGLNLRESVAMRFKIETESYEGLRAEFRLADEIYSVEAKDFDYREDGTYIHFYSLTAAQMSEPVYVTLYRGEEQVSHSFRYSVESYAYSMEGNGSIPHLAELVKAMMAYGDSARAYAESNK